MKEGPPSAPVDVFGRRFRTLRISLLQTCNMACSYCVDGAKTKNNSDSTLPDWDHTQIFSTVQALHQLLDLHTIRLTGGEPTLYPQLVPLVTNLHTLGLPLKITTNGYLLAATLAKLPPGINFQSINISLDTLSEQTFRKLNRTSGLHRVFQGIDAAIRSGATVKLNAVIIKGQNNDEIIPLLNFSASKGVPIRFLEAMNMGHLHQAHHEYLYTQEAILQTISSHYCIEPLPRTQGSTARYWRTHTGAVFGIIANHSDPFCQDCDRLRLDNHGRLYGCISSARYQQILPQELSEPSKLRKHLQQALDEKQPVRFTGSPVSMIQIGG